ncbi:MAG: DUF2461 domain-containing protein [Bernardetiaceae bacterium]
MQATFSFLRDLAQNNNRDWMHAHKDRYQAAKAEFEDFLQRLLLALTAHDPSLDGLAAKDCIYRLARDIRFSKDKSPYKTNFAAGLDQDGRKSERAFYYLHIQPEAAFIATGMYMPPREILQKIREEIDYNAAELHHILDEPRLKAEFGELDIFPEQQLKTIPRGYPKDHPEAELLRYKSFILSRPVPDGFFAQPDAPQKIADTYTLTLPFRRWLNVVFD